MSDTTIGDAMELTLPSNDESRRVSYRDYSIVAPPESYESMIGTCRSSVSQTFPSKLHYLLTFAETSNDGLKKVVSWQPHGRCFVVHSTKDFVKDVLPNWFMQSKLPSFQRQLNLYGFRRFTTGPDKGGYYHELFLRGRPDLAEHIRRTKVKGEGHRKAGVPESEPNFYRHFPLAEHHTVKTPVSCQTFNMFMPPPITSAPVVQHLLPDALTAGGPPRTTTTAPPATTAMPSLKETVNQNRPPVPMKEQSTTANTITTERRPSLIVSSIPSGGDSGTVLVQHLMPPPTPLCAPNKSNEATPEKARSLTKQGFDPSLLLQQGLFQQGYQYSPQSLLSLRASFSFSKENNEPPMHHAYNNEAIIMDALRAVAPFYPEL